MVKLFAPFHATWFGGLIGHSILIPLWTLSPVPLILGFGLLFLGGSYSLCGLAILAVLAAIMLVRLPYSTWLPQMFYDLEVWRYYRRCEIRGPHLGKIKHEKTLFMFHPHGILSVGFTINGCWNPHFNRLATAKDLDTPKSSGVVFLIAQNLREWPTLFKVLCDLSGRLESATKGNICKLMKAGRNLAIIPGGFEDATLMVYGKDRTMMSPRKGLVKYALQHGYALTPIWSFGETETYHTFTGFLKQRLALNKQSIPAVAFFGWWLLPLFPRVDSQVLSYVGAPLQLPTIAEPTPAQVDEWHAKYLQALRELHEAHKAEAGYPENVLEIW